MKMKSNIILGLMIVASAMFANVSEAGNNKGKSLAEIYSGSNAERKVDASRRNYAPSAKKNAEVFGRGKSTEKIRFGIEDVLDIIIEEKGGYGVPKETTPTPKKKTEKGVLL